MTTDDDILRDAVPGWSDLPGEIRFRVSAVPVAQPRQRHTKTGRNYLPASHPVHAFKAACRLAAAGAVTRPMDCPVRLSIEFVLPRPQNRIWKNKPMERECHAKKPDLDNLCKSVLDALTGIVWRDDSQVSELVAKKLIASGHEQPHVLVGVTELG